MTQQELIKKLQQELNKKGEKLLVDGDFGAKTQASLSKFTLELQLIKKEIKQTMNSTNVTTFLNKISGYMGGLYKPSQNEGYTAIIQKFNETGNTDVRHLAYMLATALHETAFTMKPIAEYGSSKDVNKDGNDDYFDKYDTNTSLGNTPQKDGDGALYKGRGFVQLTGKSNYEKYKIVDNPDKALELEYAAHIMVDGMTKGIFTGKKLSHYFNDNVDDVVNARRIINGTDRAQTIANYHNNILKALKDSQEA